MWELEFVVVSTGAVVGRVTFDGELHVDDRVRDFVDGYSASEILERYDGWSNGYISARRPGERRGVDTTHGAKLMSVERQDKAIRDHVETTHFFDEETGELDESPGVPPDPSPDAEA